MDNALYVGLSRQMTLQRALDVVANNIANADTAGFKVDNLTVAEDPIATPVPTASPVIYALDTGVARNFGQGAVEQTGNPYDLALSGDGFFSVQTAAGIRYTRDGRFTVNAQGQLVDQAGDPVLSNSGSPITFDPKNGAPTFGKDGTVTQKGLVVGKVGVFRFPNRSLLSKSGDNLYETTPSNAAIPAPDVGVISGAVEKSNVQPVLEITHLIAITRSYERIAQMIASTEDQQKTAVDRLGKAA
jgi:flagellar basal-body rod protein FlgF